MAMFEQTPLDEAVGTLDNVHDPPSSRHRLRPEHTAAEACAECGTVPAAPAAMIQAKRTTTSAVSSSSKTSSLSPASNCLESTRRDTSSEAEIAVKRNSTMLAGASAGYGDRSNLTIVSMQEGENDSGFAAGPVKGLAAFGSQSSLTTLATGITSKSTREASPRPAEPSPRVCTCQGGHMAATRYGADSSGTVGTKGVAETVGRPASRGNAPSPSSGIGGGAGGGKGSLIGPGGAGAATGHPTSTRDHGYRVLQWSDLSHLTYMTAGAMCEIYSAEVDGIKVAVKVPRKDCEEPAVAEHDLEVELEVLKRVNHKHIIGLVGAGVREEKPHRFLALEFLELGTLADKLDGGSKTDGAKESTFLRRQKRTKRYQDFYMVTMLERSLELAMALEHLHHHMPDTFVVHRDLKPDNVGFKADGTLKLFDFGLARVVKRRNRVNARYEMTGETGSMRYMAPEVVESLPYNEKVDVYAFGLLLWEMLEDRRVFDGMGVSDFYERVVNAGARPNLDPAWPQDLRKLISQCWHADVDRRPNFKVIAERLRDLYNVEKHSSKLSMSALNLNEDEHPKLRGVSSMHLPRSATTTNIVSPHRRGGPSSQTEIGEKKGGLLRRSFSKIGRILKPSRGGAKATLVHTAPEAYSRPPLGKGRPTSSAKSIPVKGGILGRGGYSNGLGGPNEDTIYRDAEEEGRRRRSQEAEVHSQVMPRRTMSDGVILPPEKRT